MADQGSSASIHGLLGEAVRETGDLARKEFTLFRTEMTENVKTLFLGLAMVVAAAVFAIAAVMLFTEAIVEWLAAVVGSEALAAFIVGAVLLAVAIGLALYGRSSMQAFSLTPKRTVQQVKRDGEVIAERVSG